MTSENRTDEDWYSILGAHPSDSQAELRQKYQKLALLILHGPLNNIYYNIFCLVSMLFQYHPDKQHRDISSQQDAEGAQKFIEISRAWTILGNEEARRAYDLQRRDQEMARSFPVDNQIQLEEMIWHEDEEHFSYSCRCGGQYIVVETDLEQTSLVNCDSCSLIIEVLQASES